MYIAQQPCMLNKIERINCILPAWLINLQVHRLILLQSFVIKGSQCLGLRVPDIRGRPKYNGITTCQLKKNRATAAEGKKLMSTKSQLVISSASLTKHKNVEQQSYFCLHICYQFFLAKINATNVLNLLIFDQVTLFSECFLETHLLAVFESKHTATIFFLLATFFDCCLLSQGYS